MVPDRDCSIESTVPSRATVNASAQDLAPLQLLSHILATEFTDLEIDPPGLRERFA